jgi:tetratricopeptide (TPR) repeat protein
MSKINENTLEAANLIGADYVITGYIRSVDEELQIRINLLNSSTGKLLMTKLFNHEIIDDDIKIQNEIVKDIVCNIGGYYGAVFQEIIKTSSSISSNTSILKGISSYYQYQSSFSLDNFTNALTNLKEAYNQHPNHAVIMAMMGEFHLISIVLGLEDNDSAIESANHYITKALKIDPLCQQALYSLTLINCFKNNSMGCLEAAEQCIKINPNSSIIILGLGCMLIFAGHYEKGFALLENPIKTNNNHPWWVPIGYWYYFIHKKDYKNAFYWAGKIDNAQTIWDPLLKATSLSLLNEDYKAKKYLEKVLEIQPQLPKDIKKTLFSFMLSEDIILRITGSLTKIGCLIN